MSAPFPQATHWLHQTALTASGIGLLTLTLLLPGARLGFWDRDEAEYAEVAHEMAVSGDFLVPHLFGRLYAEKPPATVWLTALSFRCFGENEFAGRLPHLLLAAGCPVLLFLLGRRLLGTLEGLFAALSLATCLLFLACGRLLLTDSALLFGDLAAVLCLHHAMEEEKGFVWTGAGGMALGFALLSKGPIAYLAPGLFWLGFVAAAAGRPRRLAATRGVALFLASALVGLPWFLLAAWATGGEILRSFLFRENFFRLSHSMEHHRGPAVFYVGVLVFGFFPWSRNLLSLFRKDRWRRSPLSWGLLAWGLGVLIFFSLSATKLPHYLLPALPAIALLTAGGGSPSSAGAERVLGWTTAGLAAALLLGVVFGVGHLEVPELALEVTYPFAMFAVLSLLLPLAGNSSKVRVMVVALAITGSTFLVLIVPQALNRARCLPQLGRAAGLERVPREPVGGLKIREPSLRYYAGVPQAEKWDTPQDAAAAAIASPTRSVLVWVEVADAVSLARDRQTRLQTLARGFNLIEPAPRGLLLLCRLQAR